MKRREFINLSAASSACVLTASALPITIDGKEEEGKKYAIKATVLKRTLQKDFSEQYRNGKTEICPRFKDGQEFVVDNVWAPPAGFCEWAWADLRTYFHLVNSGSLNTMVVCCTDGFRPVFFKLERIEVKN